MSESANQPTANQSTESKETVREMFVPTQPPVEPQEIDRSPTKTERDIAIEVLDEADADTTVVGETIRDLFVPDEVSEQAADDHEPPAGTQRGMVHRRVGSD